MNLLKKYIFHAGLNDSMSELEWKRFNFINVFALFLMIFIPSLGIMMFIVGYIGLGWVYVSYFIIPAITLTLANFRLHKIARAFFPIFSGFYLVVANYFSHKYFIDSGIDPGASNVYMFKHFMPSVFIGTFLFYDIKEEYKHMLIAQLVNITTLITFDTILIKAGIPLDNLPYESGGYFTDISFFIANILNLTGQVFFLLFINKSFEESIIKERKKLAVKNSEISTQNEELNQQSEELRTQRDFIEQKNNELKIKNELINTSIETAQEIQRAILPPEKDFISFFQDYFILFKPRDIVSGDFYWFSQNEKTAWLVVADCTGHGVPGAFMTLLGKNLLDRIINIYEVHTPAEVLEKLDDEIQKVLRQKETGNTSGMDIVVLKLTKLDNCSTQIIFAGAKNHIYYLPQGDLELKEIKGDRISVGSIKSKEIEFTNHTIILPQNSVLFTGTDGYQDQNDSQRKSFKRIRLLDILRTYAEEPLLYQKSMLEKALNSHMKNTIQRDDILLMGFKL